MASGSAAAWATRLQMSTCAAPAQRRHGHLRGCGYTAFADEAVDGVASVGSRPTFDGTKAILEVYLFDFDADIYGRYIHVDFVEFIRGQEKFASVDDLVAQMHRDADNARSILAAKGRK